MFRVSQSITITETYGSILLTEGFFFLSIPHRRSEEANRLANEVRWKNHSKDGSLPRLLDLQLLVLQEDLEISSIDRAKPSPSL